MAVEGVMILSYENLAEYTDNFCPDNYIGFFQYGRFYRGKILRDESVEYVMVKTWEYPELYRYWPGDNESRLRDEILLLRHDMFVDHPGMVKLYGFCNDGDRIGAVYQFKPMDSIYNLVLKDDFTWLHRIYVAIKVASLIDFLHAEKTPDFKPFRVRNLDCAHIVLEEDCNPKLCDFGYITGGIFPDRSGYVGNFRIGCHGYIDLSAYDKAPAYEDKKDVYAFGAILLSLISKRLFNREDCDEFNVLTVAEWAVEQFLDFEYSSSDDDEVRKPKKLKLSEKPKFSLVHKDLESNHGYDPDDAFEVTSIGIQCVEGSCCGRPTMKQVLESLLRLKVVKEHTNFFHMKMEESPMVVD